MESSHDILEQVAALDDADVWIQQLVTSATNICTKNANTDGNNNTDSTIDRNHCEALAVKDDTSSKEEDLLFHMNQIGNALHDLECYMRCYHCANLFHAPVLVQPCQHIFCSYCVRTKFHYDRTISTCRKPSCPLCKCIVDSSGLHYSRCLHPHRIMDSFVHTFRQIRQTLLNVLKEERQRIVRTSKALLNLPMLLISVQKAIHLMEQITKCSDSSMERIQPRSIAHIIQPILLYAGNIPYPTLPPELSKPRTALPKVIYNGKTKKQLVELCKETGISTIGIANDENALKKRHFDFITSYNAECDSLRPRSKRHLLSILEKQQSNMSIESLQQKRASFIPFATGNSKSLTSTTSTCSVQKRNNTCRNSSTCYEECMKALKGQRKILGESPDPTKFWTSVTTGYADFDNELRDGFVRLISQYYDRFPNQQQKQEERRLQYRPSQLSSTNNNPNHISTTNADSNNIVVPDITIYNTITTPATLPRISDTTISTHRPFSQSSQPTTNIPNTTTTANTNSDTGATSLRNDLNSNSRNLHELTHNTTMDHNVMSSAFTSPMKIDRPFPLPNTTSTATSNIIGGANPIKAVLFGSVRCSNNSSDGSSSTITHRKDDQNASVSIAPNIEIGIRRPSPLGINQCELNVIKKLTTRRKDSDDDGDSTSTNHPSPQSICESEVNLTKLIVTSSSTIIEGIDRVSKRPSPLSMNQNPSNLTKKAKVSAPIYNTATVHRRSKITSSSSSSSSSRTQRTIVIDKSSLIGPWECSYCTFCNFKDRSTRARCEVCTKIRGPLK
jgi:hypothetical protein